MNHYELTCLTPSNQSKEELNKLTEEIKKLIEIESGKLEKITISSEKNPAYFAKTTEETFLITSTFQIEPKKIETLEKKFKSEDKIIRCIILHKEISVKMAKRNRFKKVENKPNKIPLQEKNKKVELGEIDKKIDEILGDEPNAQ